MFEPWFSHGYYTGKDKIEQWNKSQPKVWCIFARNIVYYTQLHGRRILMNNIKTGTLIRELRKEKGLTQNDLAHQLHVTDRAVSKWERGLCAPDISLLESLAKILGVSIVELIEGEHTTQEENSNEIETATKSVIDYSQNEILRKIKEHNRKHILIAAVVLLLIQSYHFLCPIFRTYYLFL